MQNLQLSKVMFESRVLQRACALLSRESCVSRGLHRSVLEASRDPQQLTNSTNGSLTPLRQSSQAHRPQSSLGRDKVSSAVQVFSRHTGYVSERASNFALTRIRSKT